MIETRHLKNVVIFLQTNKEDCLSTRLFIVTFYEIIIKCESELKTQLVL